MRKIAILITIILTFITISVNAQQIVRGSKIDGKIIEKENNKPVVNATILIVKAADGDYVSGALSNLDGSFTVKNLPQGEFIATVSFIGYEEYRSKSFKIDDNNKTVVMGDMPLTVSTMKLNDIVVKSLKPKVEYKVDKRVVNVASVITTPSMTATDILENTPSVRTDVDGNITIRGSSEFTVLIDGKPSVLDSNDALNQIPASSIQDIEIMTNPSAKYEPDGTGGVINIITKKNTLQGLQSLVNVSGRSFGGYSGDVSVNYNINNLTLYGRAEASLRASESNQETTRETEIDGVKTSTISDGESNWNHEKRSVKLGVNWSLTEQNILSIEGNYGRNSRFGGRNETYLSKIGNGGTTKELSLSDWTRGNDFYSAVATYEHKFKDKGHNIIFQAYYGYRDSEELSETKLYDGDGSVSNGSLNSEKSPNTSWNFKADYVKPWGNNKLEAGLQYKSNNNDKNNKQYDYSSSVNDFVENDKFSNNATYNDEIASAYATFSGKLGALGYMAGVRGEWNNRDMLLLKGDSFNINRIDIFPTVHLSYDADGKNQYIASYSKRINRPRMWYLEPFETWSDMFNISKGNPGLLPELTDAFELGYVRDMGATQLSLEGYYRIGYNKIERVRTPYSDGVIYTTYENAGTDYSLGLEAMLNTSPFQWWSATLSANLFDYRLVVDSGKESYERTSLSWETKLSNSFRLSNRFTFQLDGVYNSPTVTSQGETDEYITVNGGIKGEFLNNRMTINMTARNIFSTIKWASTTVTNDIFQYSAYIPKGPTFALAISYRFNNFRSKSIKVEREEFDEEGGM